MKWASNDNKNRYNYTYKIWAILMLKVVFVY